MGQISGEERVQVVLESTRPRAKSANDCHHPRSCRGLAYALPQPKGGRVMGVSHTFSGRSSTSPGPVGVCGIVGVQVQVLPILPLSCGEQVMRLAST